MRLHPHTQPIIIHDHTLSQVRPLPTYTTRHPNLLARARGCRLVHQRLEPFDDQVHRPHRLLRAPPEVVEHVRDVPEDEEAQGVEAVEGCCCGCFWGG